MAGDPVGTLSDDAAKEICSYRIRHISLGRSARLAGAFYDRFLWVSDDQDDLYRAALFKSKAEGCTPPAFIQDMNMYLKFMKKYHPKQLDDYIERFFPKGF